MTQTNNMDDNRYRNIWIRLGANLLITPEEADALMGSEEPDSETLDRILDEGRFSFDGESYIPADCVEDFNAEYGTSYDVADCEL